MIAMLGSWKVWLALVLSFGTIGVRFIPIVGPIAIAFMHTKIGRSILLALALIVVGLLYTARIETRAYERGRSDAIEQVNEQNEKAESKADAAAMSVSDCYERGGDWNQERGRCVLP